MNLKKFISLLFVMLLGASSFVLADNNTRNVYSIYSENFNGAHIYDVSAAIPTTDKDGIKVYPWKTDWQTPSHLTMTVATAYDTVEDPAPEGKEYLKCFWGSMEGTTPYTYNYAGCGFNRIAGQETAAYIDMSAYAGGKIKFSARSSQSYGTKCEIGISTVDGGDYWFPAKLTNISSTWQEFSFTIPSSVTANLNKVSVLFMFRIVEESQQTTHLVDEEFLNIDNVRWVKSSDAASLEVVRKKVSDNTPVPDQTAPVSFSATTFGQGWSVADQYLELDIDGDFSSKNWKIRVYSSATEEEKVGLYSSTINKALPMAWKVSCYLLPYDYIDDESRNNRNTLQIGENVNPETGDVWGLYDAGKVAYLTEQYGKEVGDGAKWWYPWLYIQKKGTANDNSLVLNVVGCHTYENNNQPTIDPFANTYDRKPKLFLACDTKNAQSVVYTGSVIINLSYDE
ncbi:MAG: hypothetical protein K5622_02520 [Endomicrobiaceae bacterium]|nr:hypothetical protein [Endomicrobiaceae bacterium]